jgi:ubiquitin-conjugating enzyme E2 N
LRHLHPSFSYIITHCLLLALVQDPQSDTDTLAAFKYIHLHRPYQKQRCRFPSESSRLVVLPYPSRAKLNMISSFRYLHSMRHFYPIHPALPQQETERLMSDSPPGISAAPNEDNLRHFDVTVTGPESSPYEGEYFSLPLYSCQLY